MPSSKPLGKGLFELRIKRIRIIYIFIKKGFDALTPQYELKRAIIRKRLAKGMTQKDLAKKMHTRQSAISRLESGSYNPTFSFLQRVAKALDTTLTISL